MLRNRIPCLLVFSFVYCDREIHEFISLSDSLKENFDQFEIVSRQKLKSDWCKVYNEDI